MPRVSKAFFLCAVVYGICGMGLGMYMGMSQNHTLMPVHAHVNLLGWVSLAIMGGFYALAGERASAKLARLNFILSNIGVLLIGPSLGVLLVTGNKLVYPFLLLAELCTVAGMITFATAVAKTQPKAASTAAA